MDSLIHFRNKDVLYFPGGCCGESHLRRVILNLQTKFCFFLKSTLHVAHFVIIFMAIYVVRQEKKRAIRKSWRYLDMYTSQNFKHDALFTMSHYVSRNF